MDFYNIRARSAKNGVTEIYPSFINGPSKDLMVRGGAFYAVWNEELGLWSTDLYDVIRIIDNELTKYYKENKDSFSGNVVIKYLADAENDRWEKFTTRYIKHLPDNFKQLDSKVAFANDVIKKSDYVSKKLPYSLDPNGDISAYDELMQVLYSPEERLKLEWGIGSIIAGESKKIHKFFVLYGGPRTGKSTFINILQDLFEGYWTTFDAKSLGVANDQFAMETLRTNPLIAIQHDGDLSRIEDNTRINSLVSHETQTMKEKFKQAYQMKFNCMMFIGTNKPVKITDSKSGIKRRLIDVSPTGNIVSKQKYDQLIQKIKFELGAIASHCLEVYQELGSKYYDNYEPLKMEEATNPLYFFLNEYRYEMFKDRDEFTLNEIWNRYKEFISESEFQYKLNKSAFKEELKTYFEEFVDKKWIENDHGVKVNTTNVYSGFKHEMFKERKLKKENELVKPESWLKFKEMSSLFDKEFSDCKASYAVATSETNDKPESAWDYCETKLADLDTSQVHYVKVPKTVIVVDFDIKDAEGKKDLKANMRAAEKFPPTYAELSKSGGGIHLTYYYSGDINELDNCYDGNKDIEIKVFKGKSSLRRCLTKCNDIPIATINSGLPIKERRTENKMINADAVKSENGLRKLIIRNLNKEIHSSTKPSVDFIKKILDDAYENGLKYDVTDMRQAIITFALNSTHQADMCMKIVSQMKFKSEDAADNVEDYINDIIVFFDVEVFKNLFIICWKKQGGTEVVKMINPKPYEVEDLFKYKLVGYNNRRYDNHILYAASMGYSNMELYKLSQKIIGSEKGVKDNGTFLNAYNLSYTDIYDYSTKKQSLKKWEIELGIHHQENSYPWDEPLDEKHWDEVVEYCCNDVKATEAVWNATAADFAAREILVAVCKAVGVNACVNDTTNALTTKIIFGNNKNPELVYTYLEETFPGYKYVAENESDDGLKHNMYKGEDAGFGGYVYVEEGIYYDVALLDIASMHPHSIIAMNCFGEYTKRFKELVDIRLLIKHKQYDKAKKLLGGALAPYLDDDKQAKALSTALKIPINSVYGLTSAKFNNPFKDSRNINNIVALRGALFMILLKEEIQKRGFTPFHFKTDSVKIANATPEIIQFVMDFGKQYGYTFEHEATYEKICIVNGSTYIAKYSNDEFVNGDHCGEWTATAAQFQHPYVFKSLFTHEEIKFEDLCEIKEVSRGGDLYLDFNEDLGEEHDYRFIGRIGLFVPVKKDCDGGLLVKLKDGKSNFATGAKGYRWKEAEVVKANGLFDEIDYSYHEKLVKEAKVAIETYGDFIKFTE